ncbi:unnamed protein product [Brugia pahangi]|uniref:DAO domain-containing protein n=1 Tax=Brugia pahangi TaxID=6280 RepID=A0A0N4SXA3_BRUPA|nr:unnamed protein product [Brugia pahangi]
MRVGLVRATVHLNGVECSLYAIFGEGALREVSKIMSDFDRQACENGYYPPDSKRWKQKCIGYWRSTSAGVTPMEVKSVIEDVRSWEKKLIMTSPGSVGYRNVPYKAKGYLCATLPRLHAQVAVVGQLADYVSIQDKNDGLMLYGLDASNIASGPGSTTGLRIYDK